MLSGQELLDKGVTKKETTLPQLGTKDVVPNGSWLEQKQIQTALEARKHLLDAQRIEKSGSLSHAIWLDDLKLAEVTQQVGGHWHYLGHHRDKKLYLKPEEALFLMEINSLLLTYNNVVVSLQQAYALLLSGTISINNYRVYASLSRLGYKVFRHVKWDTVEESGNSEDITYNKPKSEGIEANNEDNIDLNDSHVEVNKAQDNDIMANQSEAGVSMEREPSKISSEIQSATTSREHTIHTVTVNPVAKFIEWNLEKLRSCLSKVGNNKELHKYLSDMPNMLQNQKVTINVPKKELIPQNTHSSRSAYVLNIHNVSSKNKVTSNSDAITYSTLDDVNGDHIGRVTNSQSMHRTQNNQIPQFYHNDRNPQCRQFLFWRPRTHFSNFNLLFQRSFASNFNMPRFQFYPRTHIHMFPRFFTGPRNIYPVNQSGENNVREGNITRKRKRDNSKQYHYDSIKKLARRLNHLMNSGTNQYQHLEALQRLIQTYNTRYKTNIRLNDSFEIVNDERIIDTINLDEDDDIRNKRRRDDESSVACNIHLDRIKNLASKLKHLELQDKASARHRRALSNLIKVYNKSYSADIYLNYNHEIVDRRSITLDSSSESDCVVEEVKKTKGSGKKLRNPFNILKRLSEKHNPVVEVATSTENNIIDANCVINQPQLDNYSILRKEISGSWLPSPNDFGAPVLVTNEITNSLLLECKKVEYILEFLNNRPLNVNNWVEAKIAYFESVQESNAIFENEATKGSVVNIKSIIQSEDYTDTLTVLKKLSIIRSNRDICKDSVLSVDFDVYNRDVQNFRKANRPKPHFRIVCLDQQSPLPSATDIVSLHSQYKDEILTVFAVVGAESISFLELNATELPLYISSNDID